MGKVYVIRKEGTQPGFTNSNAGIVAGGNGAQVMLTPGGGNRPDAASFGPAQFDDKNEQISGTGEYGPQGSYQNRFAQFGDKYGHLARYGLAGAGAINSFYNTTASGEPGALSAGAMGGYTGWLGSGGTERGAANLGSRFGSRLDRRNTTGAQEDENTTVSTTASPKQLPAPPHIIDAEFTEETHPDNQKLLSLNSSSAPIDAAMNHLDPRQALGQSYKNRRINAMWDEKDQNGAF